MSTFLTEQEWVDKKISEGYFGFDVCELDKIYYKEEIDELQKFFKYNTDGLDKESTANAKRLVGGGILPLKNGRRSNDSLLKWFKEITKHPRNKNEDGREYAPEPVRRYIHSLDLDALCNFNIYDTIGGEAQSTPDPERPVRYSYEFVKLFYWYLEESIFKNHPTKIARIPGISDLALSITPTLFNFYYKPTKVRGPKHLIGTSVDSLAESKGYTSDNNKVFEFTIDKISKDVVEYLYSEDLDNYNKMSRHINVMPEFSMMGIHHDESTDSRDFTILIYMNTYWEDNYEGKLRYHIPRISIDGGSDQMEAQYTYSKHHYHDILPVFTNVVVMNHMNNDNIGALIEHEVTKTLHTKNRYAVYSTYRKK